MLPASKEFQHAHDRFLCIDETIYHIGASLKDLGKKRFAFSRMEIGGETRRGEMRWAKTKLFYLH